MSRILFLIAGAILALLDSPSVAAPIEPPSRALRLGDLDLSTEAGRIQLDRRIVAAVPRAAVCGRALASRSDRRVCERMSPKKRRCRSPKRSAVAPTHRAHRSPADQGELACR
jgi:UrcA family protein